MDEAVNVQYCQEHYDELTMSLLERRLDKLVCQTQEELIALLIEGKMDPLLESTSAITSAAIQMFGPETISNSGGCPVCTFKNVIGHVADHMAVKYLRSN